jgi:hypothetical protein
MKNYAWVKLPVLPTSEEKLTGALLDSLHVEKMIADNHRDIQKVQATRKKLQDLINKYSVK